MTFSLEIFATFDVSRQALSLQGFSGADVRLKQALTQVSGLGELPNGLMVGFRRSHAAVQDDPTINLT